MKKRSAVEEPAVKAEDGDSDDDAAVIVGVGTTFQKRFGKLGLFTGTVVELLPANEEDVDDDEDLFRCLYDDGDGEDMYRSEIEALLAAARPNAKRSKARPRAPRPPASAKEPPVPDDSQVMRLARARAGVEPLPPSAFSFYIVSKGRPANVPAMEKLFAGSGVLPTWVVGEGDAAAYRTAGASAVHEGGKLTPSRNWCLDHAGGHLDSGSGSSGKVCVQLSDDIRVVEYLEHRDDGDHAKPWRKPASQVRNRHRKRACAGFVEEKGVLHLCNIFAGG